MDKKEMKQQIVDIVKDYAEGNYHLDITEHNLHIAADRIVKLFAVPDVSCSLLRSKAKEYAKFKHQDEYNDPIYHRDVFETLNDFEAGYKDALKDCNER